MANTIGTKVITGIGGINIWNSGIIQTTAMNFATKANAELSKRESKRLASNAKSAAAEAIRSLSENIVNANKNFRQSMDENFIIGGQWRRLGSNYIKDIIVHSTVADPVITETKTVLGYIDFIMQHFEIKTNLDESYLEGLDVFTIRGLIENVYKEVEGEANKIFGIGEEKILIGNDGKNDILQSPGTFGSHIGYVPGQDNNGAGELGRLIGQFNYWSTEDLKGIAMMNMPVYDKPLWDSRDSNFDAPSLRMLTDITFQIISIVAVPLTGGASIGMMALSVGINTADDLLFTALDIANGKDWREAGFEFGKTLLINSASAAIGGVFDGFGGSGLTANLSDGIAGKVGGSMVKSGKTGAQIVAASNLVNLTTKTVMAGVQTVTTGIVTSALNGVTYSVDNGFGYSSDIFNQGLANAGKNALVGMTNTLTVGALNMGLEGFTERLYFDGQKLANLTGGLVSQGVNYALGGNFTLNLFNLTSLTNEAIDLGLLELHLGRGDAKMNIGTGGADVSLGTIISAARGLETWKVNRQILSSDQEAAQLYASQLRTLYSGGKTFDANAAEFLAILAGKTVIVQDLNTGATKSVLDKETGIKTITLGYNTLADGSAFGLNVVFSHESYRNGIDDGAESQKAETDRATAGHIATTQALINTYGKTSVGFDMFMEAQLFQLAQKYDVDSLKQAILGRYDSSEDFWKLTATGGLEFDGDGYLRDVDGKYINMDGTTTEELNSAKVIGVAGIESGLLKILNLADTKVNRTAVQNTMLEAGIGYYVKLTKKELQDAEAKGITVEDGKIYSTKPTDFDRTRWMWNTDINSNKTINNLLLIPYGMIYMPEYVFHLMDPQNADRIRKLANIEVDKKSVQPKWEYDETLKKEVITDTYCNYAFSNIVEAVYGKNSETVKQLQKDGIINDIANKLGINSAKSLSEIDKPWMAQYLANAGLLVSMSYVNPEYLKTHDNKFHGHIATVVANYGTFIPALGPRVAQAGMANGIYPANYREAFGKASTVSRFYVVK
jgi:hypothetical protein